MLGSIAGARSERGDVPSVGPTLDAFLAPRVVRSASCDVHTEIAEVRSKSPIRRSQGLGVGGVGGIGDAGEGGDADGGDVGVEG